MIEKEDMISQLNHCEIISDKVINKIKSIIGDEKWQEIYDNFNDIYLTTGEVIIALQDTEE